MGALCSTASNDETAKNKQIAKDQAAAVKAEKRSIKLLLLGTGDSGKTTLRKQMRNLYGEGFSESARRQLSNVVLGNLIDGTLEVLKTMPSLNLELASGEASNAVAVVKAVHTFPNFLSPELAAALLLLQSDANFLLALHSHRSLIQLQDCWLTFSTSLQEYPKWGSESWVPTADECIAARVRTSGIVEEQFVIDEVVFKVFDVGGQRAERRKWIHSFDNVTAIIFVTAISEYDQYLFEDRSKNRLEEAIELFEEICNSRWFTSSAIMLFLNKKDLFEKKFLVDKVPLNASGRFPTAPDTAELKVAVDWITSLFLKTKKSDAISVYTHVTTATDPQNVRAVFEVCSSVILKRNLMISGFMANN